MIKGFRFWNILTTNYERKKYKSSNQDITATLILTHLDRADMSNGYQITHSIFKSSDLKYTGE